MGSLNLNYGSLGEEEQGRGNAGKCTSSTESRKDWRIGTCNVAAPANVKNRGRGVCVGCVCGCVWVCVGVGVCEEAILSLYTSF